MSTVQTFTATPNATPNLASFATPYSAGDLLGGKLTLNQAVRVPPQSGLIHSLTLTDKAKQDADIDVVFFLADPDNTTFTDNGALDVDDADLVKILGVVSIVAADYVDFADNSVATKTSLGLPFRLTTKDEHALYACLVARGTPTYSAAADLKLTVGILQDS